MGTRLQDQCPGKSGSLRGVELVVVGSGDQATTCPLGLGISSRGWECKGALSLKGLVSFQGFPVWITDGRTLEKLAAKSHV